LRLPTDAAFTAMTPEVGHFITEVLRFLSVLVLVASSGVDPEFPRTPAAASGAGFGRRSPIKLIHPFADAGLVLNPSRSKHPIWTFDRTSGIRVMTFTSRCKLRSQTRLIAVFPTPVIQRDSCIGQTR
jgi:hypothetical protein